MDKEAFDRYVSIHPPSLISKKGYAQWQGSAAKAQLRKDIADGLLPDHTASSEKELWESRQIYYSQYPLQVFRAKIRQTVKTDKYMHTLRVRGKFYKAS